MIDSLRKSCEDYLDNSLCDFQVEQELLDEFHRIATPQRVLELLDRIEVLESAIKGLYQWADAYPLDIFPEPDFKKVHKVLTASGMTLDAISASNMRHVITRVKVILDEALNGGKP